MHSASTQLVTSVGGGHAVNEGGIGLFVLRLAQYALSSDGALLRAIPILRGGSLAEPRHAYGVRGSSRLLRVLVWLVRPGVLRAG